MSGLEIKSCGHYLNYLIFVEVHVIGISKNNAITIDLESAGR